jgi:LIVCS family branched-chain amino acid:cation transporter
MVGFLIAAIGLPVMGFIAVALAGTARELAGRVHPKFGEFFVAAVYLAIGPCLAIPRTSSTAFEMLVPLLPEGVSLGTARLVFAIGFFVVAFVLTLRPGVITRVLGRITGPALIALIVLVVGAAVISPLGPAAVPQAPYDAGAAVQGFLTGYQTMDLLAALYFGIVISANIRAQQVDDESQVQKETAYAGLGTGVLLIVIYGALSYVGVVSGAIVTIDPTKDTGATVLTNLTSSLFGTFGTAFLGVVFVIACLNVCTGLIGTCATYFHTRFRTVAGRTLSYRTWQVIFTVFSFIVSNAGLSAIIKVSVPVLSALYPIAIVLVLLTLTHKSLGARFPRVYFWTVLLVGIASFATCISSLVAVFGGSIGWLDAALAMLPLQQYQLGWVVPAILGVAIGIADAPRR